MRRREFLKMTLAASAAGLAGSCAPLTRKRAVAGRRPNVLLIMADDMGYSDAQCYGGEVRTPVLSSLAARGLRFTQHYSTGRCWPSRACILSGYYAQQIRRDSIEGIERADRPSWATLLPEMLKPCGYRSYHSGKWHIDGSPKEAGFDRSWGVEFKQCDWDRFFASKPWQEDDLRAPVQKGDDYYSTVAIADHAIACLKLHERDFTSTPFFQYVTFYSPHWPLHAFREDIEAYKGVYKDGWDVIRKQRWQRMKKMGLINCDLSKKDTDVVPHWNLSREDQQERIGTGEADRAVDWEALTEEQKEFQAVKMSIHAAMITRMDKEIGRIVDQLKAMGAYENTLILFVSDNGASAEMYIRGDGHDKSARPGSAESFLCVGPGWATAANTPFRLHKHWNHEGGISSPLIVHWPDGIADRGGLRHDPCHFIDIVPTVMELAGADAKAAGKSENAAPLRPGQSLLPAFGNGAVGHDLLWWAHRDNRAVREGKWKLSARWIEKGKSGPWELYDLSRDRCEMNNLAEKYPEKVKDLSGKWERMADHFRDCLQVDK